MKYTNIDAILERVYKKIPPGVDVSRDDAVEWVWEAINKIGAVDGHYMPLYTYIVVQDYKGKLPEYMMSIVQASYLTSQTEQISDLEELQKNDRFLMCEALEAWYQDHPEIQQQKGLRYKLQDGYMHTTFEKGIVEVFYKSFPIDEQCEPLVVENVYVLDAVTWYITKNTIWRALVRDSTYKFIYEVADKEWNFYCNAAATRKLIPGRDEMTALQNKHLRIVPNDIWRNPNLRSQYIYPHATQEDLNTFILQPQT